VSISDPWVSIVIVPARGAVQRSQSEWPPALPAWLGSASSFVAPTVFMSKLLLPTRSGIASANASFSGTPGVTAGTAHVALAGDGSIRPAASSARTRNVCEPAPRSSYVRGEVQG
jgi:hypothetical protein